MPPDAVCPFGPSTRTQLIEWSSSGSKDASKICEMLSNPVGNELCITRGKGFEDTGPNRAKPLWVLCTSCPSNAAFHFLFHKARVGVCKLYSNTQETTCRELGSDTYRDSLLAKSVLCTKSGFGFVSIHPVSGQTKEVREYLKQFANGVIHQGRRFIRVVVRCQVYKQTACRPVATRLLSSGSGPARIENSTNSPNVRAVKKEVTCKDVCSLTGWGSTKNRYPIMESTCDETLCRRNPALASALCRQVAMMS